MRQAVLTLNAGSSSLKAALFTGTDETPQATALAECIGPEGVLDLRDAAGGRLESAGDLTSHAGALDAIFAGLRRHWPDLDLVAIGHRVVHGGARRAAPVMVTSALLEELDALSPLAPLHQPHNLAGIRAARAAFPGVPQVACFDTAFHRGQSFVNDAYALPRAYYAEGVRRYGFHGLSYEFLAGELARSAPHLAGGRAVIAHLGYGASVCAIRAGRSVASTMGFSALDGLPMGTRCGQIDPGVLLYLMERRGLSVAELSDLLYRRSGLLGLSGLSGDMRTLAASPAPEAAEAIACFVARCQREIAAMAAAVEGIDVLVLSGGIGENAAPVRAGICAGLEWMGITIDPDRNAAQARVISPEGADVTVMVIPTNEELVIVRAARRVLTEVGR